MGCAGSKGPSTAPKPPQEHLRGVGQPAGEAGPAAGASRVKLVLLGDSGVGKSCLVLRYVRGQYEDSSKVTVGAAFMSHSLTLDDGATLKFEIWDTAGQERYASLAPLYYRGAAAAAIVYDITSEDSFRKAKHWVSELQKNAGSGIVMALVGNKSDLVEERAVSKEEGEEYAAANAMLFVESSAKTAAGVHQIFEQIAQKFIGAGQSVPAS